MDEQSGESEEEEVMGEGIGEQEMEERCINGVCMCLYMIALSRATIDHRYLPWYLTTT